MRLTKIDVAAAHISCAVRLFFQNEHPAPVFLLASAAREVIATIGEKTNTLTVQAELAAKRGTTTAKLVEHLTKAANFMKHADRDPAAVLDFDEDDVPVVLKLACHDFGRITGGMPIEAQVFEAWTYAIAFPKVSEAPLRRQDLLRKVIRQFPGIRSADNDARKRIGLQVLEKALRDPRLQMQFTREVVLPALQTPTLKAAPRP